MDTEQLKVFLQIVDSGSIQGAARKLGATRSSLRRTLEELEGQTGRIPAIKLRNLASALN